MAQAAGDCFNRSGLIHSHNSDLSELDQAHEFVQHLITLLTISPDELGYNIHYSLRSNNELKMAETFFKPNAEAVSEPICHRKGCCGRATCVCTLREDVYKSIWRSDNRPDESEMLSMFEGVFWVCQLKAYHSCQYSTMFGHELEVSPSASFFLPSEIISKTVARPPTSSLHSESVGVPPVSATFPAPDVSQALGPTLPGCGVRGVRVKSDILMPRGTSLFEAQSSYHLLLAIHDALMGIMAFTEAGKIHCDISAYNLLLVDVTKHYLGSWLKESKVQASADVWDRTAKGTSVREATDKSTNPRPTRVESLNCGLVCVVHDTEFTIDEEQPKGEARTGLTGTPVFASAQLLEAHISGLPIPRTFIHDVESLLWVLIWVVAHHSQKEDSWQINETAQDVIEELRQNNWDNLTAYKRRLISDVFGIQENIRKFDNKWSEKLAPVIGLLASFLYSYMYICPESLVDVMDDEYFAFLASHHEKLIACSRSSTFARLFRILDATLAKLETDCPSINTVMASFGSPYQI
ncbi:hypothetical protein FRC09_009250 [Ceratobasidium sp. 395]|nr:hypothetical protein FRC09_009250 [Ceratobasidium sp. 395]